MPDDSAIAAPVSRSTYLGGKVLLDQPVKGYRAGIDAALLAAALGLRPGALACEFGCGAGAALLSAARLYPQARFTAIEQDAAMAALCAANITLNEVAERITLDTGDALAAGYREAFDAVFFNPPFFDDESALRPPAPERRGAWISEAPLEDWIKAGLKALRPKGALTLVHRADRMADILSALRRGVGDITVLPVHSHGDRPAKRVIVRAVKGARGPFALLPGLVVHGGPEERYTHEALDILQGRVLIDMGAGRKVR
ncbi:MAG: methyltransferase [Oceanicaulis sp.]|uniref:tRNA1(Val) (adenine(37)-N6)-methyltransferase n=1 Tax=Glycocaulis sp. TaxID=1969725 RepID=UPI0025BA463C|nr:methyltransferase [Glycocaulis sp.]MCC5980859.1 methyltransferase [Oceanicaulis sp.]MCH8521693.1 methyltransferase [Glycocaulis sp.]